MSTYRKFVRNIKIDKIGMRKLFGLSIICIVTHQIYAQKPVIKVDLNEGGRSLTEVNEPGYTSWVINQGNPVSNTFEGVTVTFTCIQPSGHNLIYEWYKAGIQAPWYARLANDGLEVSDGNSGSQVEMRISGLPEGKNTILTYHNTFHNPDKYTFSPIDVYLNGTQVVDDLMPSNRAVFIYEVPTVYLAVDVVAGQDVVILFAAETSSSATNKNVNINGFEINTLNPKQLASDPFPANWDKHVDGDDGSVQMHWRPGLNSVSHIVYFGEDEDAIDSATIESPQYKGTITDTFYTVTGLYSLNTYYWRIDEVDDGGDTLKGYIWSFSPRQIAFPGAEGYGRYAKGGRGGRVVEVTNLLDGEGPYGSFRWAVEDVQGPRTIVFKVSGIIHLDARLTLTQNDITIAGQTAPGKGICITGAPFGLSGAEDVVIQNLRVRVGSGTTYDGMGMQGSDHCIIDHSSISWTIDEGFSSREAHNISLQKTLISEALNIAGHTNYPAGTPHGFAASIGGDIGSFHHNLLAHCFARNWSLAGGLDANAYYKGRLDIFNNVVYNWSARTCEGGAMEVNFVNNYYKPGSAMNDTANHALMAEHDTDFGGSQRYFFSGNVMPGFFDETNQEDGRILYGPPYSVDPWVNEPFFDSWAVIHSAKDAYKQVLSDVGCTQPVFDNHDLRIVDETLNGTYTYTGSISGLPGLPDSQSDVGGFESYPSFTRPDSWDMDHDGLPGWWESLHGLDTNSALNDFSDANADDDQDGYTNIDNYLYWMSQLHFFTNTDTIVYIDMQQVFRGFTNNPVYSISNVTNANVTILGNTKWAEFIPNEPGMASFDATVTDGEGSEMTRTIGAAIIKDGALDAYNSWVKYDTNGPVNIVVPRLDANTISCYPNPANDVLTIKYTGKGSERGTVEIYDMLGSIMQKEEIILQDKAIINISYLDQGFYILTLIIDKEKHTIRFIKE
ncbi:MAG: T9SS type A sorting domain-containing protein [Bacteroidales bacterium]|nr:T9SS type A sorting domain-containing protein [Bacteroidales bacterium]